MDQWYFALEGQQPQGPVSLDDLRRMVDAGRLTDRDVVWRSGSPEWLPVARTPELANGRGAPPPRRGTPPPAPREGILADTRPPRAATPGPAPRDGASARPPRSPYPDERSAARESARSGGFLRALHSLPKPILFGMYGAVGGLLAALLLGELFWFLLRPAAASPLTAAVSDKVALYPGATNRFTVKIARSGFSGPVNVKVVGLPTDVTASSATIPADKSEAEIEINATPLVALGGHSLKVEVSAPDVPDATRTEAIHLNVEAMPPSVVLAVSPTVSVYAGDRNRFAAHLKRFLFKGAVQLELLDAPAGIILDPVVIGEESDKAELSIGVTDAKAPARVVPLKLQARALDAGGPKTVQTFNLKIEPIPPSLAVKASPSVTVYAGEKNRFAVKLARYWFDGMVRVEAADLPSDVKIGSILVPADKADAEMEIVAEKSAALGQTQIRLIATAIGADAIARENTLVKVEPVPPTVSMTLSPAVTVYAGEKNKFAVKIARQRFDGPVIIESSGTLPPGVRVPSVTIPAGAGEAEMEIFQGYGDPAGAAEREVKIKLQARALDPRVPRSIEDLSLKVITLPAKMQVAVSPLVEVYQGGRCRFTVKVARSGFEGPVRLSFADLPDGVGIDTTLLPAGLSEMEVEGAALAKAATGKKMVNLTAVGPDGRNPVAKSEFNLDVKPTDPSKLPPPLDIVFALDTTGSMEFAISGVRTGIERFIEELQKNQLEARVALLSFKDLIEDPKEEAMKIIKFKGSTFTTDFNLFKNEVGKLRADGGGDLPESSLDAVIVAARFPYAAKSKRIIILITDDEPKTMKDVLPEDLKMGKPKPATMAQALGALREYKINQVHLICKERDHKIYGDLHKIAKGAFFDINRVTEAGGGAFAALLPELSKEIARITVADRPDAPKPLAPPPLPAAEKAPEPPKSAAPPPPAVAGAATPPQAPPPPTLPVEKELNLPRLASAAPPPPVASVATPPAAEAPRASVTSTDMYSEKDQLQLLLASAVWTALLAAGVGLLLVTGQKLYLQQTLPGVGDVTKVVGAGLGAGLIGGALGQLFFQLTGGGAGWDIVTRTVAWGLLGGMLGMGIGIFVPNLKWHRGLLGGCVGGLLGALGFAAFAAIAGPLLGRWIGAIIVGFCIGLMIALAELAFRRYWLEIAFGAREVRTVTLGSATVAVGGSERHASVFVPGAPPRALGYRLQGDRILVEDYATGKTSEIGPGDERKVGNVRIAVRSAQQAEATGLALVFKGKALALSDGLPITEEDIPDLKAQGTDGVVALVSPRPSNREILLLRNRSKQTWKVIEEDGQERAINPGLSIELTKPCAVLFGRTRARLSVPDK
ncbi:MAG: GYF domain-containing protein [Gemmataceae bacterium]